jgi:beta-phosphoglucomutase family hydrolase
MKGMLGLPDRVTACLFDLDGVLTDTASVHAAAWQQTFDRFLRQHAASTGERFVPFRQPEDYDEFVDGKPREDGVRDFLASRHISLPEGNAHTGPGLGSVRAVANLKNQLLMQRIHQDGVRVFDGSRDYLEAARDAGLRRAVVSSSANTRQVLQVTGLDSLVEKIIDGNALRVRNLKGKPAPDSYLAGAKALSTSPENAAVFEDAIVGVQAGRAGGFGCVVGVNRQGAEHGQALQAHGADLVVRDLSDLISAS